MTVGGDGCIVFDIDDTLYLERDYVRSGFSVVAAQAPAGTDPEALFSGLWQLFEAGVRGRIFDVALERAGLDPDPQVIHAMVEAYRGHRPTIALLPDALACLTNLKRAGHAMACLSDGPLISQQQKVAALKLQTWLQPIVLTAMYGEGFQKPHPRGYSEVSEQTGYSGSRCVYIADNPHKDFAGPKRLGWRTVRIRRPGALHECVPGNSQIDDEIISLGEFII